MREIRLLCLRFLGFSMEAGDVLQGFGRLERWGIEDVMAYEVEIE